MHRPRPPVSKTQEGMKYMVEYLLLVVALSAMNVLLAVTMGMNVFIAYAVECIAGILGLAAFVFIIITLYKFWKGRFEFGPSHEKNVTRAIYILVGLIILSLVSIGIATFFVVRAVTTGNDMDMVVGILAPSLIEIGVAILWALIMRDLVLFFITEEHKQKIVAGMSFYILSAISGLVLTVLYISTRGVEELSDFNWVGNATGFLDIIGALFFYMVYKEVLDRFKAGEYDPRRRTHPPPPQYTGGPGRPSQFGPGPHHGPPPGNGPGPSGPPPGHGPY